jgi:hypothetical protein
MNDFKVKVTISNSQHIPAGMIVWMPTNLVIPFLPAETYTGKLMAMNIRMLEDDGTTTIHDIEIIE